MIVRALRRKSLLSCAAIALLPALADAADGPKGSLWASKDAVIYLEAPSPGALLDRVLEPKFQSYLSSVPSYAKFSKGDQFRQMKAGADFVASLLETTWDQGLRKLAGGGVVLAVEAEKGKAPWGFLAITPGDPAFLAKSHEKLLSLARADATGKGQPDPVKVDDHRGQKVYSVSPGEAHTIIRDTLVIAQSTEAIRTVIDRSLSPVATPGIASTPVFAARKAATKPGTMAWGLVRLDRLREIDPKKFTVGEVTDPPPVFLLGSWIETLRKAAWVGAEIAWTDDHLTAEVALPTPPNGYSDAIKRFLPPKGQGAPAPLKPPGVIASLGLWRDLSSIWEVRKDLFSPEAVQGFAQLDTVAGQYFGGRDFGSGVLGSIGGHWRIVAAAQDYTKISPVPDLKVPAFALVIDLKPDDEEFAQRLKVAFQSFVGLANIGAAQSKAPPLELGSEVVDGVTIATTKFMQSKAAAGSKEPVHMRQNFSPSVAQVGDHFILSSSLGLTRDLVPILKAPQATVEQTLLIEASGPALARILDLNRQRLVTQNMLEKGNDKAAASGEIDVLLGLLRYAGRGTLSARDGEKSVEFRLDFALGAK